MKEARQKRSRRFLLYDISGTGQSTETESEAVRGYQRVGRRGMGSDSRVQGFLWGDEKVLKPERTGGCTTL